jgi:putative copper resistance protein D
VVGLAAFADSLLRGAILVSLSAVVGGIVWSLVVLRATQRPADDLVLRRAVALLTVGALALAGCQAVVIGFKVIVLTEYLGGDAVPRFVSTLQFQAAAARLVLALVVVIVAQWLRAAPNAGARWAVLSVLATLLVASGAWHVHAAARLDDRPRLMALTVLHQAAAAVWVGGVLQLGALWQLRRVDARADAVWPAAVRRFSRVAIASVVVLMLAAVPLVLAYVGSWDGLVGTGYGSLVATKAALTAAALALGGMNFTSARRGNDALVRTRVPALVEAEFILLVTLLFTAAALSSQPPAVDTPTERATLPELVEVFRPKLPTLATPSLARKRENSPDPRLVVGGDRSVTQYSWSNFSHNVAGLFLLPMSLLALLGRGRRGAAAQHWPLGFVALGAFISLRSAASEGVWPFGDLSPWALDAEALQHQIGALLAVTLGILEWRARTAPRPGGAPYVLPVLAAAGGVLLLTHAHVAFEAKSNYLVQVTHVAMGALAVLLACGRWLELRSPPPAARLARVGAGVAMLCIALVLIFYREANVQLP